MGELTLLRRNHELAAAECQRELLETESGQPPFRQTVAESTSMPLRASGIDVLQINVGKVCNQTCRHCHVDAGPDRRENMSRETAEACIAALAMTDIPVLDITGGAPEMNPNFRWLVGEGTRLERHVIDRSNLTILLAPGYDELPEYLAEHRVEIVASLPCYLKENTDAQRGDDVFAKSIAALRRLNDLGYGLPGSGLTLTLVFNPVGPSLPPNQAKLEATYRSELRARHGIEFSRLFTITNMPISRFLDDLKHQGAYEAYMRKLVDMFNPAAVDGVMCRTMLSVDWEGRLHDCDFNQMLELGLASDMPRNIRDFQPELLSQRFITTGQHCYGCTAGAGSSCQGPPTP